MENLLAVTVITNDFQLIDTVYLIKGIFALIKLEIQFDSLKSNRSIVYYHLDAKITDGISFSPTPFSNVSQIHNFINDFIPSVATVTITF